MMSRNRVVRRWDKMTFWYGSGSWLQKLRQSVIEARNGGYINWRWLQVGRTTLKGRSTISANAQSLHGAALAENIRLRS